MLTGFNKVTLPFLDPSQADQYKESLPSVFIAPVGYKVPPGYKGHPLPYDPASLERLTQTRVTVVHSTDAVPTTNDIDAEGKAKNPFLLNRNKLPKRTSTTVAPVTPAEEQQAEEKSETKTSLFEAPQDPSSVVLNKLKLARNRPSLTTFYNKTRSQASYIIVDDETETNRKRKRVLTKVVRKPYNPDTTTPPPVTHEYKTTVVRIAGATAPEDELVEFQTRGSPSATTSIPEQDETTEAHVWTTVIESRSEEPEQEVLEVTTVQPVAFVEPEVKNDSVAEPSDQVQTFITATPAPATPAPATYAPSTPLPDTVQPVSVTTETSSSAYEPTPFSAGDRFRLKNRKPAHKIFASFPVNDVEDLKTSDEEVSTSTPASSVGTIGTTSTVTEKSSYGLLRNRLNLRKYGFNTAPVNNFEANSAANVYGQRIRARKRPTPWTAGYEEEDYQSSATSETTQSTILTTKKSKADQYKKKFRPFFDQLYDQLTGNDPQQQQEQEDLDQEEGEEVDEDGNPIRGWARRSTTTPNPFTINAEIYEVHPDSRERITTTQSTTTTTTTALPTTTLPETAIDYDSEPRVDDQPEEELVYVDSPSSPLEYVEFKLQNADTAVPTEQPTAEFEPSQLAQDTNTLAHSETNLEFGESQRTEDQWNGIVVSPVEDKEDVASLFSHTMGHTPEVVEEEVSVDKKNDFIHFQSQFVSHTQDPNSRLHGYEKNIQPQLQHWTEEHFDASKGDLPVVNEHTQQHMHVSEGDFIPFQPRDPEGPGPAYTEIKRGQPPVTQEETDDSYIHELVDQVYQLQEVEAPTADTSIPEESVAPLSVLTTTVRNLHAEDEVTETADDATTQTVFVTRPTTILPTQEIETQTTELPTDAEVKEATTVHEEPEVEPLPEFEAGQQEVQDREDTQTSTQQDYFEVTTFRPKVTGGFFENFNLGSLFGFISPATTTVQTPTPTIAEETTIVNEETTLSTTDIEEEVLAVGGPIVVGEHIAVEEPIVVEEPTVFEEPIVVEEPVVVVEEPSVEDEPLTVNVDVDVHDEPIHEEEVLLEEEALATEPSVPLETTQEVVHEDAEIKLEQVEEGDTVLPQEVTTQESVVNEVRTIRFGRPKAIAQPGEDETNPNNDLVQDAEIKTSNISKSVYGAIKREEYLKNWVASRKYHKFNDAGSKHGVIFGTAPSDETVKEDSAEDNSGVMPFAPTVLPNISKEEAIEWETSGVSIKKKRRKINPLLDKLSSSRKSLKDSLFAKSISSSSTTTTSTSSESSVPPQAPLYPRGSDTKIFKQWQGDSLSQAEFERKVLGVSTATEVSVKSVICVRGRCYNADNVPSFVGH